MNEQEYSESGSPIYRYDDAKPKDFTLAIGDVGNIEAISKHIETNVGKIEGVYHEIISHLVHIDIHWVKANEKFPFHTLVTSGMSDIPMAAPAGFEAHRFAELCILLPESWPLEIIDQQKMEEAFKDERNYWPIRWLKMIARFPHEYNTWISHGHTIPNGENAEPFADNTKLGCMMLMPSLSLGGKFYELKIDENKTIKFYCLYPLYKEEMDFKIKKGLDPLLKKFEKHNILDVIDIERRNTCSKIGFFKW